MRRRTWLVLALVAGCSGFGTINAWSQLRQPAFTRLGPGDEPNQIIVTFGETSGIRAKDNTLINMARAARNDWHRVVTSPYPSAIVRPYFEGIAEEQLSRLTTDAETRTGLPMPDLNLNVLLTIPTIDTRQAETLINQINALSFVAIAQFQPKPMPAPGWNDTYQSLIKLLSVLNFPPDYTADQKYRGPQGINSNAVQAQGAAGAFGDGVTVFDHEYSMNIQHTDLNIPATSVLLLEGYTGVDPFKDDNHGTAVAGEVVSENNWFGTQGIAPNAAMKFTPVNTDKGKYNVALALIWSLLNSAGGDIFLIEQQMAGPNYSGKPTGTQFGLVPVEWNNATFQAIKLCTALGRIVVEAGGNGNQNLDNAVYNGVFTVGGPAFKNSGAILVGAGTANINPYGTPRVRLPFSNYGTRVNLQAWGEQICTTGYGDKYSADKNTRYAASFGGTSGASPIITGAAAVLQGRYKALCNGQTLQTKAMLTLLQQNAQPQQFAVNSLGNPIVQPIGPMPNLPQIQLTCLDDAANTAF